MKNLSTIILLFLGIVAAGSALALQVPGPLVETGWLEQHRGQVTLLDVRDDIESFTRKAVLVRKRFTGDLGIQQMGAHIPGAVIVDFFHIRSGRKIHGRRIRYLVPEEDEFNELMQSWGVNRDAAIVIVAPGLSNDDMTMATRLYWQIKYYGHDNVAILNGGMAQWLLEQRPASIEAHEPAPGNWVASAVRTAILADSADVTRAMHDRRSQLVDARSLGQYLGTWKKSYVRAQGHIPGAKVFPSELLTSAEPPVRFNEPEALRQIALELGIDSGTDLVTYCNSGQLASGSWFLFSELLGNKNVKLYDGSMHQWAVEKRPVTIMKME